MLPFKNLYEYDYDYDKNILLFKYYTYTRVYVRRIVLQIFQNISSLHSLRVAFSGATKGGFG